MCERRVKHLQIFQCVLALCWRTGKETLYIDRSPRAWRRPRWTSEVFSSTLSYDHSWACPAGRQTRRRPSLERTDCKNIKSKRSNKRLAWLLAVVVSDSVCLKESNRHRVEQRGRVERLDALYRFTIHKWQNTQYNDVCWAIRRNKNRCSNYFIKIILLRKNKTIVALW